MSFTKHVWRRAVVMAGLGSAPLRMHDLRHTAASIMLASGVPLIVVSRQLGHSSRRHHRQDLWRLATFDHRVRDGECGPLVHRPRRSQHRRRTDQIVSAHAHAPGGRATGRNANRIGQPHNHRSHIDSCRYFCRCRPCNRHLRGVGDDRCGEACTTASDVQRGSSRGAGMAGNGLPSSRGSTPVRRQSSRSSSTTCRTN